MGNHGTTIERDPSAAPTFYFMIWGFVLLAVFMLGLQYLAWNRQARERDAKATPNAKAPGHKQRTISAQKARLEGGPTAKKPISAAMQKVVAQYQHPH